MKLIPKNVLEHCGQKAAQHAVWPDGKRVTRHEWRVMRGIGPVSHTIEGGQVVVHGACLLNWQGPIITVRQGGFPRLVKAGAYPSPF